MFCPHCGAVTAKDARFCATCGRPVESELATAATIEHAARLPAGKVAATHATAPADPRRTPSSGWLSSSDSISHGRFAPGAVLDGRYRVIGLLGRGGMGEVYRADDLRLGQAVALKFLPDATDPARLAQFHNEVRTARQISHANICRVYDIGEVDGHPFLSMEFVDGEDLATSLRRIGRFPEDKATDIARQLCAGLAAAHERGVLHRDLKPANVMLDGAGKVRLMDFGLAAVGAVDNIRAGTPAYMAPEQLQGREVTTRSDIFALGLVLYELFTGRRAFTATTLNELIEQHEHGELSSPRTIVSTIDPAIERVIMRCLDRDPASRPPSALAVAAALPGGDPLAAALAAGETPSPAMVAAAGQGAGLSRRVAVPLFVALLVGTAAAYWMAMRTSLIEHMQPEYAEAVLAQKARDMIGQLGYTERPQDEAHGFVWDEDLTDYVRAKDNPSAWDIALSQKASPLLFWYRRSPQPMVAGEFHHDLLTSGIVNRFDPPPIQSGMVQLTLDHQGRLMAFEAIPPQVQPSQTGVTPIDWTPVLKLAGLDGATLQPAAPQWNSLATADTRMAWTGTWSGGQEPLRVEAAALNGIPVSFQVIGPWTKPWRTSEATTSTEAALVIAIFLIVLVILVGGGILARNNLRAGRGDRAGALTFGCAIAAALWGLWLCQVHVSASVGMVLVFMLAVCTTVFYAVLFWAIYLALEPFVRRHWPRTLVSWTTILSGRMRDPIVGRDVLFGVCLGVAVALLVRGTALWDSNLDLMPQELLMGVRSTVGEILSHAIYAVRTAMFVFFLLFLLRLVLRNQWLAALAFVTIMSVLQALNSDRPLFDATTTFLYFGMFAVTVLRWGLTSLTVGVFVADLLLIAPATANLSAWYAGAAIVVTAIPVALTVWAFSTSNTARLGT